MNKVEAAKVMYEHERDVVFESLAEDVAKAFGTSLHELRITPRPANTFHRLVPMKGHEKDLVVSMYEVASHIAKFVTSISVYSDMNGAGSYADDITEKAIAMLCDCSPLVPNSHHESCPAVVLIK